MFSILRTCFVEGALETGLRFPGKRMVFGSHPGGAQRLQLSWGLRVATARGAVRADARAALGRGAGGGPKQRAAAFCFRRVAPGGSGEIRVAREVCEMCVLFCFGGRGLRRYTGRFLGGAGVENRITCPGSVLCAGIALTHQSKIEPPKQGFWVSAKMFASL